MSTTPDNDRAHAYTVTFDGAVECTLTNCTRDVAIIAYNAIIEAALDEMAVGTVELNVTYANGATANVKRQMVY